MLWRASHCLALLSTDDLEIAKLRELSIISMQGESNSVSAYYLEISTSVIVVTLAHLSDVQVEEVR